MAEFEEGIERVVAGLEKQTRIIHEEEKLRVAYHECGHALVACSLPNTDPVHKISIIPRGLGALGYTMSRPEDDRRLFTQSELQHKICVLLGGINAEEIVFKETSTGAQRDLQQASDIARSMVTEFGMSAKLGRVRYSERARSQFLGTDVPNDSVHSEETIREIDLEVKRIIESCGKTAFEILTNRRVVLGTDVPRAARVRSDGRGPLADRSSTSTRRPRSSAPALSSTRLVGPKKRRRPPRKNRSAANRLTEPESGFRTGRSRTTVAKGVPPGYLSR